MIYLTKGQPLIDNLGLVVCDPTGYYNDGDSVACAPYHMPDEPIYRYEAKFIAYGGMVYEITDEDKLLEEVKKLNPETLFGKNKEDVAVDKIVDEIVLQESSEIARESANNEPTTEEVIFPVATSTDQVIAPSTPPAPLIDPVVVTSTPVVNPEPVPDINPLPIVEAPIIESVSPVTSTTETVIETVNQVSNTVQKIIDVGNNINNIVQ